MEVGEVFLIRVCYGWQQDKEAARFVLECVTSITRVLRFLLKIEITKFVRSLVFISLSSLDFRVIP